jgi:hypothetical protein
MATMRYFIHAFQAMNIRVRMRYVVRTLMWTHGTRVNMLHMRAGDAIPLL